MRRLSWILVALALAACEDERRRDEPEPAKPSEAEDSSGDALRAYSQQQAAMKRAKKAAELEVEVERMRLEDLREVEEEVNTAMQALEDARSAEEREAAKARLEAAKVEARKRTEPTKQKIRLTDDCLNNPLGC